LEDAELDTLANSCCQTRP